jgi:hypothetical protein
MASQHIKRSPLRRSRGARARLSLHAAARASSFAGRFLQLLSCPGEATLFDVFVGFVFDRLILSIVFPIISIFWLLFTDQQVPSFTRW